MSNITSSPYIVSNWVEGHNFYGRKELCRTLTSTQERCIYLVGMRRIGKTSILKRLAEMLSPYGLYCDLMQTAVQGVEHGVMDEARLVRLLRRELSRQVERKDQTDQTGQIVLTDRRELLRVSRPAWDSNEQSLVTWLEEVSWAWEELGITVTLLWDEAEMLRRLPSSTLMGLRAVFQHSKSLRIIVCASKGLAALNDHWREADVSPFLFGFKTYYISGMSDEDARLLISQRGQVEASPAVVAAIHRLTGNHPFLLQTLCDRLYQQGTLREPRQQDSMVEPMMADLFRIDVAHLSPGEQHILFTLARHGPLESSTVQQYTSLSQAVLQNFLHGMAQLGYARSDGGSVWSVGNEFLAQWLRLYPVQADSAITDQASLEVVGAEPAAEREGIAPPALDEPLSEREDEVLQLLARGRRNPEIARALMISENTVKAHLKSIYRKLGVGDRVRAVNRARELGLV